MTDVAAWDGLIRRYVDGAGRVDYGTWQRQGAGELEDWLAAQRPFDSEPNSTADAMALWINLYNALVIKEVLARFPLASIRPTIAGVPNWPAFLAFFSRPVISLQGQPLSLNRIEHEILRPRFGDPRLHFALVCAAVGCPLLRPEAYRADRLEAQLEEDALRFLLNPQKLHFDQASGRLHCSRIFQWYRQDFLAVAPSIAAYVGRYLPELALPAGVRLRYLPYDWALNG
ncbi:MULTISPECIES: DUF547 domain-containing protein [unclassified Cyanobium]|uniref:DUF547 domain-containing protein n=1 Tax=unclassified Cyanobium TaxID=2627006 RepID=UPI0020CBA086|nr:MULTISPECIES: DUF547 domain-containing protein [unclassified Cyanobium]MCP9834583.1 DUF547 domain-containing protein [Cyanobium sp. La Preciosa 7G6]MCP9937346.1 DUF547 domain-containing protein [Cyanobium sp. Aljojuca 7A6]